MDGSDDIELILPHVFDELEDGNRGGRNGFDCDFVGDDGLVDGRVCGDVLSAVFVSEVGTITLLVGEGG